MPIRKALNVVESPKSGIVAGRVAHCASRLYDRCDLPRKARNRGGTAGDRSARARRWILVAPSVPVPPKFWPTAGRGEPCSAPLRVSTVPYVNERYENGLRLVCFGGNLTSLNDGAAVAGAKPFADVFLGAPSHPAPLTRQTYHETAAGSYSIGPIWFDAPGKWTTRFHFFPDYCDEPASPHGHAAFYVYVP